MKKNVMTRIASGLMVAVLLTTCVISGTFAKYVTESSATDSARVAKWGVTVTADAGLFEGAYFAGDHTTEANRNKATKWESWADATDPHYSTITVHAESDTDIVAPGTKSSDNGLTFSIKGTPEVATKITFDFADANNKDIFLAKGTYADLTTTGADPTTDDYDVFSFSGNDYYPVVFTLTSNGKTLVSGKLSEVETYLKTTFSNGKIYDANTNLAQLSVLPKGADEGAEVTVDGTYHLTWAWAFEDVANDAAKKLQDQKDTLLGDLAVKADGVWKLDATATGHDPVDPEHTKHTADCFETLSNDDFSTKVSFDMKITVTQVD